MQSQKTTPLRKASAKMFQNKLCAQIDNKNIMRQLLENSMANSVQTKQWKITA